MTTSPQPAVLTGMEVEGEDLRLDLRIGGEILQLSVPVTTGEMRALAHVVALHDHDPDCPERVEVHVDVLRRCVQRLDARILGVIVQEDLEPTFWLRLATPTGPLELELALLDAVSLLVTRNFPLHVRRTPPVDWDASLRELMGDAPAWPPRERDGR